MGRRRRELNWRTARFDGWPLRLRAALASVAVSACVLIATAALPAGERQALRERVFDALLAAARPFQPAAAPLLASPIVVVDVDRESAEKLGEWPWRREVFARLVAAVAKSKPRAIGIDVLFAGAETRSPAAMARKLSALTGRRDIEDWAESLSDDDKQLAESLAAAPVALGFALDPEGAAPAPGAPVTVGDAVSSGELWRVSGATLPGDALMDAPAGLGAIPLPGDSDGVVRRVPALVAVGREIRPGLALETLRLALAEPVYEIAAAPEGLQVSLGQSRLQLPRNGMVRLAPDAVARADVRVISAAAVLAGAAPPQGAIVLIGVSLPEAGALRASAANALTPTTLLQAAALADLRDRRILRPARLMDAATPWIGAALGVAAMTAGIALPPIPGFMALIATVAGLLGTAVLTAARGELWDPSAPVALAAGAGLAPILVGAAATYRRERRLRRRFAQHLAPEVVQRIVADPGAVRLAGERRLVTSLFTDIEGFTQASTLLEPETVVRLLDGYFEGVARLIHARGGMIDKFVGDAVHAFFGMPLDLENHVGQAIGCACDIVSWTENYRRRDDIAKHGLGRTRIGIESGLVVAGEVGAGEKLDYTAYGDSVNLASRLEAANKRLGTAICVGPEAARLAPEGLLRPIGRLTIVGLTHELDVFGPWPPESDADWRRAYLEAWEFAKRGDPASRPAFARLGEQAPSDPVCKRCAEESA